MHSTSSTAGNPSQSAPQTTHSSSKALSSHSLKDFLMIKRLAPKSHRHGEVSMDLPILEILRHQRHKHINLLLLPAQRAREERQAEALKAFEAVDLVPAAELFHERVFGPAVIVRLCLVVLYSYTPQMFTLQPSS